MSDERVTSAHLVIYIAVGVLAYAFLTGGFFGGSNKLVNRVMRTWSYAKRAAAITERYVGFGQWASTAAGSCTIEVWLILRWRAWCRASPSFSGSPGGRHPLGSWRNSCGAMVVPPGAPARLGWPKLPAGLRACVRDGYNGGTRVLRQVYAPKLRGLASRGIFRLAEPSAGHLQSVTMATISIDAKVLSAVAALLLRLGATEVFVFGSATKGDMLPGSDIDMAVRGLPPSVYFSAISKAAELLGRPVDLVDLDDPTPIVRYLLASGELVRVA